jgi:hypothetical protein
MEIRIGDHRTQTYHVNFYAFGTDRIITAAIRAGPTAVEDVRIWTSETYEGTVGLRQTGEQTWIYPGATSAEGFSLGTFNANQEKSIEIKLNLPSPPGRPGENLIPLRIGNGGAPG